MVKGGEVDSPILPAVIHLDDATAKFRLVDDSSRDHHFAEFGYDANRLPVVDPQRGSIVGMDFDLGLGMHLSKMRQVLVSGVMKTGFCVRRS